jgi:hypothetical protein
MAAKANLQNIWETLRNDLPRGQTPQEKARRDQLFKEFDTDNHNILSLAKVDYGCRKVLGLDAIVSDLHPILIRAFTSAKDAASIGGAKNIHPHPGYVGRAEFRLLFVYIHDYFELWFMFEEIDKLHEHRFDLTEFKSALDRIDQWGIAVSDPEATFKELDQEGGGHVLFVEFADWALKHRLVYDKDDHHEALSAPPPTIDVGDGRQHHAGEEKHVAWRHNPDAAHHYTAQHAHVAANGHVS